MSESRDPIGSVTLRRWTELGLGLLLTTRLILLGSDWLQSRKYLDDLANLALHSPHFFNTHLPIIRLTTVLVVAATISLAVQIRRHAGLAIMALKVAAAIGYATASFFGPTRWNPSINGPYVDQLGDSVGYARLLATEVVLDGLVLVAVLKFERQARQRSAHPAERGR